MEQNKGQIFFFGRPDSLKHCIPIRTNNEELEKKSEESAEDNNSLIKNEEIATENNNENGVKLIEIESDNLGSLYIFLLYLMFIIFLFVYF